MSDTNAAPIPVSCTVAAFTADSDLASIARAGDPYAAVLDRHRLDFCCGGRRTLGQACVAAGLDAARVLEELEVEEETRARSGRAVSSDWSNRPLPELTNFIVRTHHAFTRAAIARISPLLAKVAGKHADRHPELEVVAHLVADLANELQPHLLREERVLFPYIDSLSVSDEWRPPMFGTVANPIRMMMGEHESAGALLTELATVTAGFTSPDDACTSYRALYAALAELRRDLLLHISLENNVLFPRALALEEEHSGSR